MTLEAAQTLIAAAFAKMNALYNQTVFDEWVLVSLPAGQASILDYHGPRVERYRREFVTDVGPLRKEMAGKKMQVGDFEFAPEAAGTRYDVCLRLGASSYLFGNHTGKSIAEIRRDPRWLQAQRALFELSEKFRADPLD